MGCSTFTPSFINTYIMNRRQIIQQMVLLSGGIMLAPSTLAAIDTWSPDAAPANDQTNLIAEIADLIIPDTDTPGAKAAKTEQYILLMLQDCTPADQREAFFKGLEAFDQACMSQFGRKFLSVRLDQRQKFLEQEDAKGGAFIRQMKWLTMAGYFSSEIGMTKAQAFLPVPGKYVACAPLNPGQRAWANYF